MSAATLALPSAGGVASACSPLYRSATMMSKKSSSLFPCSLATDATLNNDCYSITAPCSVPSSRMKIGGWRLISCEVALRSNNSATSSLSATVTEGEEEQAEKKIGARVRVKAPLKVYHVPRVPEVDLTGKEGHLKQYVALWKGKRISANLPYKIEFVVDIEGRGPVKFFAHLKEDEFEYLD